MSNIRGATKKAYLSKSDDTKYLFDMSDDLKESIDKGEIKLVTNRKGEIYAQLGNANGRFGKSLPIKKELAKEENSV